MRDTLLAYAHHLCAFTLVAMLAAQWVWMRGPLTATQLQRLARVDAAYGAAAGLLLAAGLARVVFGAKGASFYTGNPVFWVKVTFFVVVGLLSIAPTVRLARWRKAPAGALPSPAELDATRKLVSLELVVLLFIPLAAAMMARGIGY